MEIRGMGQLARVSIKDAHSRRCGSDLDPCIIRGVLVLQIHFSMSPWKDRFSAIISVYLVLENEQKEVLLLLRQNTGFCDGQYGLPAGHMDGNEPMEEAMCREAKEETGLLLNPSNLRLVHTMHRHCGDHERIDLFFHCAKWEGEPDNTEPHKCAALTWFPIDHLPSNTIEYYRQMFHCIREEKTHSCYGWEKK